jgi:tellurite resistance protein TerC
MGNIGCYYHAFHLYIRASLISRFEWIMYVFGAFLVFTGIECSFTKKKSIYRYKASRSKVCQQIFKVHNKFEGNKFFVVVEQIRKMTPLFLNLLIAEFTDLIFRSGVLFLRFSIIQR